jgi:ATP-binding cassette subfamily C protein LapB
MIMPVARRKRKGIGWIGLGRVDVFLLSIAVNLLSLTLPLVILQVYDRIIPEIAYDTFAVLMVGIAVAVILDFGLRGIRDRIVAWSAAKFEHRVGTTAVDRILTSEITDLERDPPSLHLERLAAIDAARDFHSGQVLVTIADLPFVAVFLGLIWLIAGDLVYAPLALAAAAAVTVVVLGMSLGRALRARAELDDKRYNFIFKVLSGIHTVKGLGLEAQMSRRYEQVMAPLAKAVERVAFLSNMGQVLSPTFSSLAMVATAALGSLMVVGGDITGGTLIACILLAGRAVQPLSRLVGLWVQSRTFKIARERLNALLKLPHEEDRFAPPATPTFDAATEAEDTILLDGVTVHRGRPDFPVLRDVHLRIPTGAFVAVSGPVGGGKTALLDLLAGLTPTDEGRYLYRGKTVGEIGLDAYRAKVGCARQNAILYKGTIKDNLSLFGDRDDLARALGYARDIGLDEAIAMMPKGLGTEIGDTASDVLPASVQQQIGLVRVLSRDPELVLLDEANSAFDLETDRLFRELLQRLKGTVTIVMNTSRPSLVALADMTLSISFGEVTAMKGEALPPPSRERMLSHEDAEAPT